MFNSMCGQICQMPLLMCTSKLNAISMVESTFRCTELTALTLFRRVSIEEVIMVVSRIMHNARVNNVLMLN